MRPFKINKKCRLCKSKLTKNNLFIINKIASNKKINSSSKILEIGSNNCTFLDLLKFKFKCIVLGVDPAKNLKSICESKNIKTESLEFNYKTSLCIKKIYGEFDLIILRHVFANIHDLKKIIKGLSNLIKKNGTIYIENAYALNTFQNNEFDQIYHEHMSYISIKPLINFFKTEQINLYDAFKSKIHGGSISIFLTKDKNKKKSKRLKILLNEEEILYKNKFIDKFVKNTKKNKKIFIKYIKKYLQIKK